MREAGGLDNTQIELRGMGIPFMGVVAVYADPGGGTPDADDAASAAGSLLDGREEGLLPVIAVSEGDLRDATPFDGQHPGRTVIAPDGTIIAHFGGHGNQAAAREAIIDHFESQ